MSYPPRTLERVGIPSEIGATAEREVAYFLERAGWSVYLPMFAAHSRVDLMAVDPTGRAVRVQVKTSRLLRGGTVLMFRTCSNTNNSPASYDGQIDAFGIWSPELEKAYLVPIEHAPTRGAHLRLMPPANNQRAGIRYAADYEIRPPG